MLTAAVPLAAAVVVDAVQAGAPLQIAVVAGALLAADVPRHVVGAVLAGVLPVAVVGPVVQGDVAVMALLADPAAILLRPAGRGRAYICSRCGEPKKSHWCTALYK